MDETTKNSVRECKRSLLGKPPTFEPAHVERIIHGVRVSDEQAYAFMQVHAAIAAGRVLTAGVKLDVTPTTDESENLRILQRACKEAGLPSDVGTSEAPNMFGPYLKMRTTLRAQQTIMCDHLDECNGDHGPVAIKRFRVEHPIFELDLCRTSATRTWAFLKLGTNVARWMEGSGYLHFLLPTEEYELCFRGNE